MTITLAPDIESALTERAQKQGTEPEALALDRLRAEFVEGGASKTISLPEPRDDWERLLASVASDAGVSHSNEALSSEGPYTSEPVDDLKPRDAWEALVLGIGVETGVSLSDHQVSREVIYEDHD